MGLITDRMKLYEQALWFAGVTVEEKRFMSENQSSAPIAENKMGTMPVGKLVFNMSLPMMISMLVQALYNIVDSIFVAKLSENALTAVS